MQVRSQRSRRNRSQGDPSKRPVAVNATATVSISTAKMRLTTDTPVQLVDVPTADNNGGTAITAQGNPPINATQVNGTTIDLTFTAAVSAGQSYSIPQISTAIRTPSGGYLAAKAGTF